jgi:fibronectin-binding autotransporter adhesin
MNLIYTHITNNNLILTISKGDFYGTPSIKSAVAARNWLEGKNGMSIHSLMSDLQFTVFKRSNNMKTQSEVPGSDKSIVDSKNKNHQTFYSNTISKRSNIMKNSTIGKYLGRGMSALLTIVLIAAMAMGQNLVIGNAAATFAGAGSITVRGAISNAGVASAVTIANPVTLNGAAAQAIGTATNAAINFTTLNVSPSVVATTTLNVASSVSTAVNIGTAGTAATLAVGANTLSIGGTSAFLNAGSALNTVAASTVVFNQAAAGQTILGGFTYTGLMTLSGGTKALSAATATTVSQAFDASAAGLLTVSGGGLNLGTTGTFAALTNSATIKNGSGLATFGAVTNTGTIDGTVGAGALTFGSTVANTGGTIKGGAALATFNGLLTQTATGILTSGAGGLTLTAGLTNTLGNITLAAGQSMSVSGGQFTQTAGVLTFPATSTVTYGAGATQIVDMAYGGNLTLNGDAKTMALTAGRTIGGNLTLGAGAVTTVNGAFDLTVGGNISLAANLTKSAFAVVFTAPASFVTGSGFDIIGAVTRTHAFVAATPYTFNNASMILTPTVVGTLSSYTINSSPGTNPTGGVAGNSVQRKYSESSVGTYTATLQLAYLAAEYTGINAPKLKDFQNGIAKANKLGGAYVRNSANGFNYVALPGLTNATLISGQELGIDDRYNQFISIAATAWNVATTWDMLSVPGASDDVEIAPTFAVTIPTATVAAANSVLIDAGATGGLSLVGTATLNVGAGGLTNNNIAPGAGLTVPAGTTVSVLGGDLTNNGAITNAGAITVQ